jgi:hypothetical protein
MSPKDLVPPPEAVGAIKLTRRERKDGSQAAIAGGPGVRPDKPNGHAEFSNSEMDEGRIAPLAEEPPVVWADPKPLPAGLGLLPVATFDTEFLPKTIGPWVADIADRMQCPVDFVAIPAMIALGSVIGCKIGIRPQRNTDWMEVANLWGYVVGLPGAMKSPAFSEALKPLRRLETLAREMNAGALKDYNIAYADYKLRTEAARSDLKAKVKKNPNTPTPTPLEEPAQPKSKRHIVIDATYESLGVILADNPNGVVAHRDELVTLLRLFDHEDGQQARGFFLTAWNGRDAYSFDRIVRGLTHLEITCLSVLGTTQPGKIAPYIARAIDGGDGDDGMIQRFGLAVWPDQKPEWQESDRYANVTAREVAWETFDRLDKMIPRDVEATDDTFGKIPYLRFDGAAQLLFSRWHRELETMLRNQDDDLSPALKGHYAKYRKLVPSLALINYLADGGKGDIDAEAVTRAINFSRYLETHAKRIYAAGSQNETTAAKAILAHIKRRELEDGFAARDVQRRGWSNLAKPEQIKAGLDLLTDLKWIAEKQVKSPLGGRSSVAYFINPKAKS